ncbi:MAG TPA: hypothetical protein VKA89_06415 [Solirubrobacterales bacterium]|nr:hypothetical protein [Solirubrobacterales bacterium]
MPSRAEVVERERRWALPVALLTLASVVLAIASLVVANGFFSADGEAAFLREVDDDPSPYILSAALRALSVLALIATLTYFFRAAEARSERVRGQLYGLILVAPLFYAAGTILTALSNVDAASSFVDAGVTGTGDAGDDKAIDFQGDASLRGLAAGIGLAGTLGLTVVCVYTFLWAMRVGLLSRFWGSLAMALGAVSFILPAFLPFFLILLIYLGLLVAGWVPRGRPPAWEAGEAVPWPTPGERMADQMQADEETGVVEGEGAEKPAGEGPDPPRPPGERRKRKRRS